MITTDTVDQSEEGQVRAVEKSSDNNGVKLKIIIYLAGVVQTLLLLWAAHVEQELHHQAETSREAHEKFHTELALQIEETVALRERVTALETLLTGGKK